MVVSRPTLTMSNSVGRDRSRQTAGLGLVIQGNPDDREIMEKGLLAAMGSDPAARVSRPKGKTKATMRASPPPFSPNMAAVSSEPRTKSDSRADPYWA
jgi:hypothetical protein